MTPEDATDEAGELSLMIASTLDESNAGNIVKMAALAFAFVVGARESGLTEDKAIEAIRFAFRDIKGSA